MKESLPYDESSRVYFARVKHLILGKLALKYGLSADTIAEAKRNHRLLQAVDAFIDSGAWKAPADKKEALSHAIGRFLGGEVSHKKGEPWPKRRNDCANYSGLRADERWVRDIDEAVRDICSNMPTLLFCETLLSGVHPS